MLQDVAVTGAFSAPGESSDRSRNDRANVLDAWQLALIGHWSFPLFWLRSIHVGRRIREVARKQRRREGAMAATFSEIDECH